MYFITLIMLIMPFSLFSQTIKEDYPLNAKYRGGNNLIYDCLNKHYACVNDVSKVQCQEDRDKAIELKDKHYPCAVLKSFSKKEECLHANYRVLNDNVVQNFCFSK